MSVPIVERLTNAIRIAEQSMSGTQSQYDYRNWHEVHRTLQDARDELGKPPNVSSFDPIQPIDRVATVQAWLGDMKLMPWQIKALQASQ